MEKRTVKGKRVCYSEGQNHGAEGAEAEEIDIVIRTPAIPNYILGACVGQIDIYRFEETRDKSGAVIESSRSELTDAPVVQ